MDLSEVRIIRSRSLEPEDLQALLKGLSGSPELRTFRELVEPLEKHDRERNSDLVRTLSVFFASGANVSRTADRLLLHRNSIPYRLERVSELTGLDSRACYELDKKRLRNAGNGDRKGTKPTVESAFLCDFHASS